MSLETKLYQMLSTHPGLSILTDVFPVIAPENTKAPYCVYEQVSGGREYTHQGYAGLKRPRVQISCYGSTYEQAKEVAAQVTAAMENWVYPCFQAGESDGFEEDVGLYHVPVDFYINYEGE